MECGCCNTCVSFRAGVPKAPLHLVCEELELSKEKVLDGAGECQGVPWSSWRGWSPAEGVRMAAGLTRAAHSQELCCAVLLGRFLLVFCLPQRELQGWCKQRMGLGRPQGSL